MTPPGHNELIFFVETYRTKFRHWSRQKKHQTDEITQSTDVTQPFVGGNAVKVNSLCIECVNAHLIEQIYI